ncbi:MAG: hypothetical protein ACK41W_15100 [Cyanobacteriota bacterium]|jgi:hypothetical protein
MARVFLSHSSRDNAAAVELKGWLDDQGFRSSLKNPTISARMGQLTNR